MKEWESLLKLEELLLHAKQRELVGSSPISNPDFLFKHGYSKGGHDMIYHIWRERNNFLKKPKKEDE